MTGITIANTTHPAAPGASLVGFEAVYTSTVGQITSLKNNLVWSKSPGSTARYIQNDPAQTTLTDSTVSEANYNMTFNNSASTLYDIPTAKFLSSPGANDPSSVDPQFVDPSRRLTSWAQGIDAGLTTWNLLIAELRKLNDDSGYNAALDLRLYRSWVRAGFAPTNPIMSAAGLGGTYIGAVEPVSAPVILDIGASLMMGM